MKKTKIKKRLNMKRTLVFILFIYILCFACYKIYKQPIKHIEITGTDLITDNEILVIANLKDYPSIFKYTCNKIEKKIKTLDLVDEVTVKKKLGFIITINVKESKPLFYYIDNKSVVLSNGNIIKKTTNIMGIPILINKIESNNLKKFINNFNKINKNIIYEMEEITYTPKYDQSNNIIDEEYTIKMLDGNTIITTRNKCNLINKYNEIYASLNGKLGTLYLSSGTVDNLVFIPYGG